MDMYQNPYMALPGITPEEMAFLQQGTTDLNENQKKYFYMIYSGKKKKSAGHIVIYVTWFCRCLRCATIYGGANRVRDFILTYRGTMCNRDYCGPC